VWYPSRMRFVAVLMVCLAGVSACRFKGADPVERTEPGEWPFRPVAMRIHPFTSLELGPRSSVIEARLELIDPVGDVTKGVGAMRFELYAEPPTESRQGQGRRLYTWDASIAALEENQAHWDSITRTYHFTLKLPERPARQQRLRLHVQFDSTAGRRMTADAWLDAVERE